MREILFRAKHYRTKKWVYGIPFKNPVNGLDEGAYYPQIIPEVHGVHSTVHSCSVIEETIGQYTGLTDSEGKKIFEGDIVLHEWSSLSNGKYHHYEKFIVTYEKTSYYITPIRKSKKLWRVYFNPEYGDYKIVGNIYDNPELMKEVIR